MTQELILESPEPPPLSGTGTPPRPICGWRAAGRAYGHGQSPGQEAFTTIGDLLTESITPPKVSAALYRAAALIPGVSVIPRAVDAIGRPGVAMAFTYRGSRSEWIFDHKTLQWFHCAACTTAASLARVMFRWRYQDCTRSSMPGAGSAPRSPAQARP